MNEWWPPNSITWDGKEPPKEWDQFWACAYGLLSRCKSHPKYQSVTSLLGRSFQKMGTVLRTESDRVYIQTGFAQRGLDLGMMLGDGPATRRYWELMPVSVGVAMLTADAETIKQRNRDRPKQDRSWMVEGMMLAHETALEVLKERGPVIEVDTREPIEANKSRLLALC